MFPFRRNSQAYTSASNIQQHRYESTASTTPAMHICTCQRLTWPWLQNSLSLSGSCAAITLLNRVPDGVTNCV